MIKTEIPILNHIPERIFNSVAKRLEVLRSAHVDCSNEELLMVLLCEDTERAECNQELLMVLLCEDTERAERNQEILGDSYRDHLQDLQSLKSHSESLTVLIDHKIRTVKQKGV